MKDLNYYKQEEKLYEFDSFSREDALKLGLKIHEIAKQYPDPVASEITINGLVVFRYFPEGTISDSSDWLQRKRNSVDLMHMSSLGFLAYLEHYGAALEDRKLDPNDFAACGGGFPIMIKGTGMIGSICVSGLPNHEDDHQLIVDSLAQYIKEKM